jgi:SNF2 family DNA or RNA helicase
MPQSTSDLVSQFDFLWPGGDVFEEAMNNNDELKRIQMVNHIIRPLYVRTTKSELGLTPPKIKFTKIKLGPIQRELYDLLRSEIARLISGMDKDDIIAFRRLGKHVVRLLQIASNPMLISATDYEEENSPIRPGTTKWQLLTEFSRYEKAAKIQYSIKRVRELTDKNEKVVIWSVFVQNIELLERILCDLGAVSIYGDIETGDENESYTREGRIRRFHEDPNCMVMIANPAACGEGISLHKICHTALYLDRTFNAAHYLQSVDRIHRLGLPSNITTNVEILLAEDTIDDTVVTRLGNKIAAMSAVLEDADLRTLAYDPEDIIGDVPGGIDKDDFNEIKKHLEGKT